MIKIYDIKNVSLQDNDDRWDFPITEIDYLLEEHKGESFVFMNNRLYEISEDEIKKGDDDDE